MVLPWPFPPQRFLVPFLPFFLGGFVLLLRDLTLRLASAAWPGGPLAKRAAAAAAGLALFAVAGVAVANCFGFAPETLARLMANQRTQLAEMRGAYQWIATHTPSEARFIAYDDVLLYLYADRQTVRPIACSTAAAYDNDPAYARRDAAHLDDVARHLAINYWLVTPTDFDKELGVDRSLLTQAENDLLAPLPIVYQSNSGRIRIDALRPAGGSAENPRLR
jgi:hypothetical protein